MEMATRNHAHPLPAGRRHEAVGGWTALVNRIGVDRIWLDALPERVATTVMGPATLMLRLTMAWIFAYAGFDKLIGGFSASGFLLHGTSGPLTFWFHSLGASQTALNVINPLVVYGEILIGMALLLGIFTRAALFFGSIQLMLYYLAQWPPANNPFMGYHLVYILILGLLGALGAGRILGLDPILERIPWVKRHHVVTLLLG
jgi:thiosulfate dehydrogenase [quinone] large subunit